MKTYDFKALLVGREVEWFTKRSKSIIEME